MLEKSMGILFYLKKSKKYKSGPIEIYMRITVDGNLKELSSKVACPPNKWNSKAGRAVGTTENIRSINATLDALFVQARNARTKLIEAGADVTAMAIRDIITGANLRDRTILKLFEEHNQLIATLAKKEGYANSTLEMYEVAYRHAKEFICKRYKVNDLNIRALGFEFVEAYYNWLKIEKNQCHNTAIKNIGALKKNLLASVKRGWLPNDPFALFPITKEDVDTVFLCPAELEKLMKKQFVSERVAVVRDMFVFCCSTA